MRQRVWGPPLILAAAAGLVMANELITVAIFWRPNNSWYSRDPIRTLQQTPLHYGMFEEEVKNRWGPPRKRWDQPVGIEPRDRRTYWQYSRFTIRWTWPFSLWIRERFIIILKFRPDHGLVSARTETQDVTVQLEGEPIMDDDQLFMPAQPDPFTEWARRRE